MDTPTITRTVPTSVGYLAVHVTGSGPPTVLWHSLFVDSTTWAPLSSHLVAHRRLISIDGPGHGAGIAVQRRFTLEECAAGPARGDAAGHAAPRGAGPPAHPDNAPTLMIVPRADTMISLEQARAAAATTMDGAGHVTPLIEDPGTLADVITAFWRDPGRTVITASADPS